MGVSFHLLRDSMPLCDLSVVLFDDDNTVRLKIMNNNLEMRPHNLLKLLGRYLVGK